MKLNELESISEEANKRAPINCNEFHCHTTRAGCREGGDKDAITILLLCAEVVRLKNLAESAVEEARL